MEELFFAKSNFEMIYGLIEEDIHDRFKISVNDLSINAREILYESMVNVFSNSENDSLDELNKNLLINCIPIIANTIPDFRKYEDKNSQNKVKKQDVIDLQNMFIEDGNIDNSFKSISIESKTENDIETQDFLKEDIEKRIVSVDIPKKTIIIQKELDVNSGDRNNWLLDKSNTPYDFIVNLGASNTFNGISTPNTFRNVVGINLTHIIIPSIQGDLDRYPFLYLQIDEVSNIYESTSELGRRSFVKLLRDKKWSESTTSNIYYYSFNTRGTGAFASVGWKGETPIGSLNQLTIRVLSSNGNSLKKIKDVYEIEDITETANELIVKTTENIYNDFLHVGNRIGFKHLITNNDNINNFLENNEHIITKIANNNNIHFEKNIEIYDTVNTYTNFDLNTNQINISQGSIMNLSVQTTFGFKINCKVHSLENEVEIV